MLERDCHTVNFHKFLGKHFYRTPPSNHISHDVVFFVFPDQWGLEPKISLFGGAMVNSEKKFTSQSILCSYGTQVEASLSSCGHTCTHLGILIAEKVEEKEGLKNLLMWGNSPFMSW